MKNFISTALLSLSLLSLSALAAENVSVDTLAAQISAGKAPLVVDVRTEDEFLEGHIPGARLIPHDEIGNYVDSLAAFKDEPILIYCRSGKRAESAVKTLEEAGFSKIQVLEGSFSAWQAAGQKTK
jgi:rhodanese-related sulfurtransferase